MLYYDLLSLREKYSLMLNEKLEFIKKYELEAKYYRNGNLDYKEVHDKVFEASLDVHSLELSIDKIDHFVGEL